jgi:hypothetical protein
VIQVWGHAARCGIEDHTDRLHIEGFAITGLINLTGVDRAGAPAEVLMLDRIGATELVAELTAALAELGPEIP